MSRSSWRSRRLLILCYHGFSQADEHVWDPQLYVSADHLESRLRLLIARGYRILPLGEALNRLETRSLPDRAVAITVDDGNYDFYAVAYPILQRFGIPVTIYVSTYYVQKQLPVFDVSCSYLLWQGHRAGQLEMRLPDARGAHSIATAGQARSAAGVSRNLVNEMAWSAEQKHAWLGELAESLGLDWEGFLKKRLFGLMNSREIAALDPAIADVQLHTHRHRVPEDHDRFLDEIRDNRAALEACSLDGRKLVHFCYPSGVHRQAFLAWLNEAGIRSAVTGTPGLATSRSEPFLLPRFIDTTRTSEIEFEAWLSGFRHLLRRRVPSFGVAP